MRRYGAGQGRVRGGLRHGPSAARGGRVRPVRRGPGSVARDAGAARARGLHGRAGVAHRRAVAVGVVRPRLQHEGAGARPADRARRRRAGAPGAPRRPPAARVLQSAGRCATSPSGWAGPGGSPATAPTRATCSRASTRCRARATYLPAELELRRGARGPRGDAQLARVRLAAAGQAVRLGRARGVRRAVVAKSRRFPHPRGPEDANADPHEPPASRAPAPGSAASRTTSRIRCPTTTTAGSAGSTATGCRWGSNLLPAGGKRVLEVGVGSGVLVPTLTRRYPRIHRAPTSMLAPGLRRAGRARLQGRVPARRSARRTICPRITTTRSSASPCWSTSPTRAAPPAASRARSRPAERWSAAIRWSAALMTRAFSLIGYKNIDDDHVSAPAQIAAALAGVLTPVGRAAFPPAAPVPAALYQARPGRSR